MNKILLEVCVPIIEKKYEVFVPVSRSVEKITLIIIKSISEMNDGVFDNDPSLRLYYQKTGDLVPLNVIIKNSGLVNGSKVLLV